MRYLTPAFVGEGVTDYQFVRALVERHLEALLLAESEVVVEVGPVIEVLPGGRYGNSSSRLEEEVLTGRLTFDILFVHADAAGHPDRVEEFIVEPIRRVVSKATQPTEVVAVAPDRETEAWMLADVSAVSKALGLKEIPAPSVRPRQVHTIFDPKAELNELIRSVSGDETRPRAILRSRSRLSQLYSSLAEQVDLDTLREIPAFLRYESELRAVLRRQGLIA